MGIVVNILLNVHRFFFLLFRRGEGFSHRMCRSYGSLFHKNSDTSFNETFGTLISTQTCYHKHYHVEKYIMGLWSLRGAVVIWGSKRICKGGSRDGRIILLSSFLPFLAYFLIFALYRLYIYFAFNGGNP